MIWSAPHLKDQQKGKSLINHLVSDGTSRAVSRSTVDKVLQTWPWRRGWACLPPRPWGVRTAPWLQLRRARPCSEYFQDSQSEWAQWALLQWLQNGLMMAEARLVATLGFMAGNEVCGPLPGSQNLNGSNTGASKCLRWVLTEPKGEI